MQRKMKGPGFTMRGWSPFTQKEEHKKLKGVDPKHPVTPPTEEESERSKGTLTGKTGFEQDILDPAKDILSTSVQQVKSVIDPVTRQLKREKEAIRKGVGKIKDYFTKR